MLTMSVALCTHNGALYIAEQLRSILEQQRPPSEIVLSDDASRDETVRIARVVVEQWQREHPATALDFRVIENPAALGVAANFERAIAATTGDLVALADQDDVWLPHRLGRIAAEFDARPRLTLLHTDASLIDGVGDPLGSGLFESLGITARMQRAVHDGRAFEVLMKRNIVTGATTVFRRGLAETASPFPSAWLHDEWLAIVASVTGEVDLINERLIGYRQHGANEIGVQSLTLAGKAARMLEQGAQRNARLLQRARQLDERMPELVSSESRRAAAADKLAHESMRSALPSARPRRVASILREIASGRYRRFGRGFADAVRDLLQPL